MIYRRWSIKVWQNAGSGTWSEEFWFPQYAHPRDIQAMTERVERECVDIVEAMSPRHLLHRSTELDPTRYLAIPQGARMIEIDEARST